MIHGRPNYSAHLVLVSFVLQATIPIGYMPAGADEPGFVKLCPDGLTAQWMTTILGEDHSHHLEGDESFVQCDLGGGLGAPIIQIESKLASGNVESDAILPMPDQLLSTVVTRRAHRPRSPPLLRLT